MDQEGLVQFVEEESGSGGKKLTSCCFTVYCIYVAVNFLS